MAGRLQHYLPRFLQQQFSHPKNGKGEFVFVHTAEKSYESNINNNGKERDFYSDPSDTSLDDVITKGEKRLVEILRKLNSPHPGEINPGDCATLMGALMMRTKTMRVALSEILPSMMSALRTSMNGDNGASLKQYLMDRMNVSQLVDEAVAQQSKENPLASREMRAKRGAFMRANLMNEFRRREEEFMADMMSQFARLLDELENKAVEISDKSFLDSLGRDPHVPSRVEWLKDYEFSILQSDSSSPFILGDCAVVGFYSDNSVRLPIANVDENIAIDTFALPISPNCCLVAKRPGVLRTLSANEVNLAQIRLSREFFVSSALDDRFETERSEINTVDPFFTRKEMVSVIFSEVAKS